MGAGYCFLKSGETSGSWCSQSESGKKKLGFSPKSCPEICWRRKPVSVLRLFKSSDGDAGKQTGCALFLNVNRFGWNAQSSFRGPTMGKHCVHASACERETERERERDGRKYRDKNTGSLPFVGEISHNGVCIQFRTRQTVFRSWSPILWLENAVL